MARRHTRGAANVPSAGLPGPQGRDCPEMEATLPAAAHDRHTFTTPVSPPPSLHFPFLQVVIYNDPPGMPQDEKKVNTRCRMCTSYI